MNTNLVSILLAATAFAAEPSVQSNVVYGMYSGAALLLDVHRPANPNGFGIVYVSGSGWTAPVAYSAPPLKSNGQSLQYAKPLVAAGYTVFTVNHRSVPRFRYPAAVEDVQRAVRFIRAHAPEFGIRPDRIGAAGGSSGGHLVSMLGTLDGNGTPGDPDPVERESAKVQCVVARAAPTNFFRMRTAGLSFLGMGAPAGSGPEATKSVEYRTYREASPLFHVSPGDPPILLIHGDKDESVPFAQSEEMEKALKAAGVTVKLIRIEGAGHGPSFPGATNPPDYLGEMVAWFNRYLAGKP
ncbi:MAG TPA: alpha/beta hydrolase [Bryobacteraceae bacterium]|nr:alpha/beta hydrolase [Bryobacteraceae bacterium]